jgi:hypothetical protein
MEPIDDCTGSTKFDFALAALRAMGSDTCFEILVDKFWNAIYFCVLEETNSEEAAAQCSEKVFLKLRKNLHRLRSMNEINVFLATQSRDLILAFMRLKKYGVDLNAEERIDTSAKNCRLFIGYKKILSLHIASEN